MAGKTSIEWTDATWNPVRGCSRVSPGCFNCYAERTAIRQAGPGKAYEGLVKSTPNGPQWTNKAAFVPSELDRPMRWRKPRVIFVTSMSDLFHKDITDEQILSVFQVMAKADHHVYQVLTKRPDRLKAMANTLPWPDHVWMGTSVENADYLDRIDHLRAVPAKHRFISAEPLLGPLGQFDLKGIEWVIAGGESGPRARAMHKDWVREVRDHCFASNVMFHFKQWGGVRKGRYGRMLDGRHYDDMPSLRQQPEAA